MCELRVDVPVDDLAVLDAFVQANSNRSLASVVRELIRDFSHAQVHTATMVLRAKRINPRAMDLHSWRTPLRAEDLRKVGGV